MNELEKITSYKISWYKIDKVLRNNWRHYTYLSKKDWEPVVVKVLIWDDIENFKKEIERNKNENWKYLSWARVLDEWENYFVTKYVEISVNDYLKENLGNTDKIDNLFNLILNWAEEISVKKWDFNRAKVEFKKRVLVYTIRILTKWVKSKVLSLLWKKDNYWIEFWNIVNIYLKTLRFSFDESMVRQNHSCFHLNHAQITDTEDKLVWIDWEHSVKNPYRFDFLDEAYVFQNLLHKQTEELALKFLEKLLAKYPDNKEQIKIMIIKKLLWGIQEILWDLENNPDYIEKIQLHQKILFNLDKI